MRFNNGRRLELPDEWPDRRRELLAHLIEIAYGPMPPVPSGVSSVKLHSYAAFQADYDNAITYRVNVFSPNLSFLMLLMLPPGPGPFPVFINGDGCWLQTLSREILGLAIKRGYAVAVFNRVEIAPDNNDAYSLTGLPALFPRKRPPAIAAWAWGCHRVADALLQFEKIDPKRIGVTGHSRGGKTALLAGATDERIALTAPNNSGCGGAGCFRFPDQGGETLERILAGFPHWFSKNLSAYAGREDDLPFDLHSLKACVAPRLLLSTEARGDIWASPRGARRTFEAARELYRFLGKEENIGICYREGGHAHQPDDWEKIFDFADSRFEGRQVSTDFNMLP